MNNTKLFCQEANKLLKDKGYRQHNYFQDKGDIHFSLDLLCFFTTSWQAGSNGKKLDKKMLSENIPLTVMWLNEIFGELMKTYKIYKFNIKVLADTGDVGESSLWYDFNGNIK